MSTRSGSRRGVTLVEFLIALAILGGVTAAIVTISFNSQRMYRQATDLADAQAQARIAMQQLERDIRSGYRSSYSYPTDLAEGELPREVAFETLRPNTITPVAVRYFLDDEVLMREEAGGTARTLVQDVRDFVVSAATGDTITVLLTVQVRERDSVLETRVMFRNP
jgi:prepilin-type N-terminal cleavage/methylation domain-containing protein